MNHINEYKKRLSTHDFALSGDKAYFSALTNNGLYVYDIQTRETEYVTSFDGESMQRRHLYGASMIVDGKVYFAPMNASKIAVYNLTSGNMIMMDVHTKDKETNSKFYDILRYGNSVLLIPSRAKHLVTIDTKTLETEFHSIFPDNVCEPKDNVSPIVKNGSFIEGHYLYLPLCRVNGILKVSLVDYSVEHVSVDGVSDETGFVDAVYDDKKNELWLLVNRKSEILKTTIAGDLLEKMVYNTEMESTFPYMNMVDMGETLFLPSYQAEYNLMFDKANRCFLKADFEETEYAGELEWEARHYTSKKVRDDLFIVVGNGNYEVSIINSKGEKVDSVILEDKNRIQRIYMSGKDAINESLYQNLAGFLDMVVQ